MTTTTYQVSGMTCQHCVHAVEQEVGGIPGVRRVDVQLVDGGTSPVTVDSEAELDEQAVRDAVDEAGFELVSS